MTMVRHRGRVGVRRRKTAVRGILFCGLLIALAAASTAWACGNPVPLPDRLVQGQNGSSGSSCRGSTYLDYRYWPDTKKYIVTHGTTMNCAPYDGTVLNVGFCTDQMTEVSNNAMIDEAEANGGAGVCTAQKEEERQFGLGYMLKHQAYVEIDIVSGNGTWKGNTSFCTIVTPTHATCVFREVASIGLTMPTYFG
jgi:hypothetical protein